MRLLGRGTCAVLGRGTCAVCEGEGLVRCVRERDLCGCGDKGEWRGGQEGSIDGAATMVAGSAFMQVRWRFDGGSMVVRVVRLLVKPCWALPSYLCSIVHVAGKKMHPNLKKKCTHL